MLPHRACMLLLHHKVNIWLFMTPWTPAHQASLSFTISQSSFRFMSTVSVMLARISSSVTLFSFCLWVLVLEKNLEGLLDYKEIKPVNPKGNQPWVIIGRTDVEGEAPKLQTPDVKNWLIGKDPDAGKDWRAYIVSPLPHELWVWPCELFWTMQCGWKWQWLALNRDFQK